MHKRPSLRAPKTLHEAQITLIQQSFFMTNLLIENVQILSKGLLFTLKSCQFHQHDFVCRQEKSFILNLIITSRSYIFSTMSLQHHDCDLQESSNVINTSSESSTLIGQGMGKDCCMNVIRL